MPQKHEKNGEAVKIKLGPVFNTTLGPVFSTKAPKSWTSFKLYSMHMCIYAGEFLILAYGGDASALTVGAVLLTVRLGAF